MLVKRVYNIKQALTNIPTIDDRFTDSEGRNKNNNCNIKSSIFISGPQKDIIIQSQKIVFKYYTLAYKNVKICVI